MKPGYSMVGLKIAACVSKDKHNTKWEQKSFCSLDWNEELG